MRSLRVVAAGGLGLAAVLFACVDLKSDEPAEPLADGDAASAERGADARGGEAEDASAEPEEQRALARTCPLASDRPPALGYVTTPLTVFDSVTRLMWERNYRDVFVKSYGAATNTCTALRTEGHDDWRVPTRSELFSIVDYSEDTPKISPNVFPKAMPDTMWTSSFHGTGANDARLVDFFYGSSLHFADLSNGTDAGPSIYPRVRCVRTVDPQCEATPRFTRQSTVVLDRVTGLEWSPEVGSPRDAAAAATYCSSRPGGTAARPWRLPSVKESDAIITESAAAGYVASAFPKSEWTAFWVGTQSPSFDEPASYKLETTNGTIKSLVFSSKPMAVRCVR